MKTKIYTAEECAKMHRKRPMSLCTMPGMKVVFATFEAGYEAERKEMQERGFKIGHCYTVSKMDVGRSSSSVALEGFPWMAFNTVFFCNVPRQKLPLTIPKEHMGYRIL